MDGNRFDNWSRRLAHQQSRRTVIKTGLGAAVLGSALAGRQVAFAQGGPNEDCPAGTSLQVKFEGFTTVFVGQPFTSGGVTITITAVKDDDDVISTTPGDTGEPISFTFVSVNPISAVIVKSGQVAAPTLYNPAVNAGGPLTTPANNPQGIPQGISNIQFCVSTATTTTTTAAPTTTTTTTTTAAPTTTTTTTAAPTTTTTTSTTSTTTTTTSTTAAPTTTTTTTTAVPTTTTTTTAQPTTTTTTTPDPTTTTTTTPDPGTTTTTTTPDPGTTTTTTTADPGTTTTTTTTAPTTTTTTTPDPGTTTTTTTQHPTTTTTKHPTTTTTKHPTTTTTKRPTTTTTHPPKTSTTTTTPSVVILPDTGTGSGVPDEANAGSVLAILGAVALAGRSLVRRFRSGES